MEFENIIRYRPMEPAQAGFAAGARGFSRRAAGFRAPSAHKSSAKTHRRKKDARLIRSLQHIV